MRSLGQRPLIGKIERKIDDFDYTGVEKKNLWLDTKLMMPNWTIGISS